MPDMSAARAAAGPLRVHELVGAVITSIDVDADAEDHLHVAVVLPDGRTTAVVSTQPVPDAIADIVDGGMGMSDAWVLFDTTDTDGTVRAAAEPTDWQTRGERHGED